MLDWHINFNFSGKAGETVKQRVAPQCDFTKEEFLSDNRVQIMSWHVIESKVQPDGAPAVENKLQTNHCRANQVFELEVKLLEDVEFARPACVTFYGKARL